VLVVVGRWCHYRRCSRALQCSTHTWHKPGTMRLLGWRDYRIIKIRRGNGDRRGSARLIIIVTARVVGDGPFREAACTAVRQGDAHLKFSFEDLVGNTCSRTFVRNTWAIFLEFTTKSDVMAKVLISSGFHFFIGTYYFLEFISEIWWLDAMVFDERLNC
jgi:hypothetical protein